MLLRQALEQTRAGMPPPILFNTRMVGLEPADEVSSHTGFHRPPFRPQSCKQQELFVVAARNAATAVTGAHAS